MKKITPLGGRVIATSRGIKEETEGGVIIPEQYLDDSDICTIDETQSKIIRARGVGVPIDNKRRYLLKRDEILAYEGKDGWAPASKYVIVRKCLDPKDESGLISISERQTSFAEILAAGDETGLKKEIGDLARVDENIAVPQKIEDTQDDWLIHISAIEFVMGE